MGIIETPRAIVASVEDPVQNRRRHVRYPIPARCTFEGTWHPLADLSVGGLSIIDAESCPRVGTALEIQLLFPLRDYSIILSTEVTVRYFDKHNQKVGLSFNENSMSTESVIRHLVDAFVANEVVSVGDVMEVSKRFNDAKARNAASAKKDKKKKTTADYIADAKRIAKASAFLVAGLCLVLYVARNSYSSIFLKNTASAYIDVRGVDVGALSNGTVKDLKTKTSFDKGEPIFSILGKDGALSAVTSPCDCWVLAVATTEHSFVREGDILLRLAAKDATPFIRAKIDSAIMMKLAPTTYVDLTFIDAQRSAYRLVDHPAQPIETPQRMRDLLGVDIMLSTGRTDLPISAVGETVRLRFDTSPVPWLRRLLLL